VIPTLNTIEVQNATSSCCRPVEIAHYNVRRVNPGAFWHQVALVGKTTVKTNSSTRITEEVSQAEILFGFPYICLFGPAGQLKERQ
jgi:hypothetical protein